MNDDVSAVSLVEDLKATLSFYASEQNHNTDGDRDALGAGKRARAALDRAHRVEQLVRGRE